MYALNLRARLQVPFILKNTLREYQHIGLDWLVSLYHKHLNGILADEMGATSCTSSEESVCLSCGYGQSCPAFMCNGCM